MVVTGHGDAQGAAKLVIAVVKHEARLAEVFAAGRRHPDRVDLQVARVEHQFAAVRVHADEFEGCRPPQPALVEVDIEVEVETAGNEAERIRETHGVGPVPRRGRDRYRSGQRHCGRMRRLRMRG